MYDTTFLLTTIDTLIESAQGRLNELELQLLQDIRNHIAEGKSEKEVEQAFFELVKWLLLIVEYLKNTS